MADEIDTTIEDDADFGAGFSGVEGKPDTPASKPEKVEAAPTDEKPEYVQVTAKEWNDIKAAAAKTASYDQQFSRLFGTTGNIQKLLNDAKIQAQAPSAPTPPTARRVEISKAAFSEMERDFPELAQQTRAALEAALSGLPPPDGVDATKIEGMLASYTNKREIEALEDAHPDWRTIVGAVDATKQHPDPDNPFRKWLGTKDAAYQDRINNSESAAVIGRAIRLFQNETKVAPKVNGTARNTARADLIRAAVQPKGDNGGTPGAKTEDDEFESGYRTARG
jgi:hypothetical protein